MDRQVIEAIAGVVYRVTNTVTGKQYVGKTTESLRRRWKRHVSNAASGRNRNCHTYLCRSIRKHGPEVFTAEVIGRFSNETQLTHAEQLFIAELNTQAPSGYNLTSGGDGLRGYTPSAETRRKLSLAGLGNTRPPMTLEHREALRLSRKGVKMTPEFCQKRSEYMKLHNPMLGRTHSPEARQKISEARRRRANA